jgi:TonB family protein
MRIALLVAGACSAAGAALAQQPLDAKDVSLTKKPALDMKLSPRAPYPADAKRKGQEGEVTLRTCVDQAGKPHDASVAGSSGYPLLDETSLTWLSNQARFKPAETAAGPVSVCNHQFTLVWSLRNDRPLGPSADYPVLEDLPEADRPRLLHAPTLPSVPPVQFAGLKTGKVELGFCLDPTGKIVGVEVQRAEADMQLVILTLAWIDKARYLPAMKEGKPTGVCGLQFAHEWVKPEKARPNRNL